MIASSELFDLIKSLSRAEKIYFKRHSLIKSDENKNYLLLFDEIEKQKMYDEEALRHKFKNHAFARQFPVAKLYLQSRILKALDSFHNSFYEEIRTHIHHAEIYFEKRLFRQSLKNISKAKQIALEHDLYSSLPDILFWESKLAHKQQDIKRMDELLDESNHSLTLLQNIQQLQTLAHKTGLLIYKYGMKNRSKFTEIKKLIAHPLLQNESKALTFTAKQLFYETHIEWNYACRNNTQALKYLRQSIQLYEKYPHKKKNYFFSYIVTINNYIVSLLETNNFSEAKRYLSKFHAVISNHKRNKHEGFAYATYYNNLLSYWRKSEKYQTAKENISKILEVFKKYEDHFTPIEKASLLSGIAEIYFGAKDYSKSLSYQNKIRDEIPHSIRPDVDSFLRLFYIITHYELKHYSLLSSLIRSAYRYYYNKKDITEFEKIILLFLGKISRNAINRKGLSASFYQLRNKLLALSKNPDENHALAFFDYLGWLESKMDRNSFAGQ